MSSASRSSSGNVSYELYAPRSNDQVSKLSRIAALTASPAMRAAAVASSADSGESKSNNNKSNNDNESKHFLMQAMSPPKITNDFSSDRINSFCSGSIEDENDAKIHETLSRAIADCDNLTVLIKHSTSLRLALRASLNIAEDISNRHATLIRHSGELSAAAERLQQEETMLTQHAQEIGKPLQHYDAVDSLGVVVGVLFKASGNNTVAVVRGLAKIKVDNADYNDVLTQIDNAVEFFGNESGGKPALDAELKRLKQVNNKNSASAVISSGNLEYFRRSLILQEAALFLIKEAVVDRISTTTEQISAALNLTKKQTAIPADKLEASLIYTRFHGISARSNRLLALVRLRLNVNNGKESHIVEAYQELWKLCRTTYCTCRESLLQSTVRAHLDKLKDQHGIVGMTRLASVFLIRLCTVETALYLDFFGEKQLDEQQSLGDGDKSKQSNVTNSKKNTNKVSFASQVVSDDGTYYDSEFQNYLSNLCGALHRTVRRGVVTVLELDTLCQIVSVLREERSIASSSPTTTAAARAISNVIADAQERLIFCATNALTKEVIRFKATPKDLDYPDKLRKLKESKSTDQQHHQQQDVVEKQMQIYESWFPPIRSVLQILSKIFRVVEPGVFEDIALQSVQACTKSLKDGGKYILKRQGVMHSDLFLVKHLLILREQLSPFDIELRSVERQLDFSDAGKAVSRFLANRNRRLFSMSTENALVTLLREGVSIQEASVDSKRDLEDALRSACNEFIDHTCHLLIGGVMEFCQKLSSSGTTNDNLNDLVKPNLVETMLTKITERLEVQLGEVTTQMGLYLDNPATQSILLKPVQRKVTKTLEEAKTYIRKSDDNDWNDETRSNMFTIMDSIDKAVKKASSSKSAGTN